MVQKSKHFNTDFTERKIKPQICTENGRITRAVSCVYSPIILLFSE